MELSNTQQSQEEQTKQEFGNKEILKFEEVKDTPFTIVEQEGKYFGVLGQHRITEVFEEKTKLQTELKKVNWNKVVQVIWAVAEKFNKNKK